MDGYREMQQQPVVMRSEGYFGRFDPHTGQVLWNVEPAATTGGSQLA